ncbi:MAG: cobyric acid synthase [Beijerinckiaceae bacterium]|nr:cobyric acid synthase [Beijerinckiaceae bacterium]
MVAKALMIQGTGSDVGKSLIVAGLCRVARNRGLKVLPFKPQNMSNNAAVTADGGEIGRAQALQARAAGVMPTVHMNPVLLKPQSEIGSQIIVQGRVEGTAKAKDYQLLKPRLLASVLDSFNRLKAEADLVIIEGAGSAAEVNLRANDIANMGFARAANVPVILLGDIDRGGVIAQIVGTKAVITPEDAELIQGFMVNRFRGDPTLFEDGMRIIAEKSGWKSFGLIPHFKDAFRLPAEDAVALDRRRVAQDAPGTIAVLQLPRISNFDDFDPLAAEKDVKLLMVRRGEVIPGDADLVIIPGSKATIADLAALRAEGWDIDLKAHLRRGGRVLGVCGGYQMLGSTIEDPQGIEGVAGGVAGLGLLDVSTIMAPKKTLLAVSGTKIDGNAPFSGYEMHIGVTSGPDTARPVLRFDTGQLDGARSADDRVRGVYVHGLFADDRQRAAWLDWIGAKGSDLAYDQIVEETLEALAEHLEVNIDIDGIIGLAK